MICQGHEMVRADHAEFRCGGNCGFCGGACSKCFPPNEAFQQLAKEFRRLAAEAFEHAAKDAVDEVDHALWYGAAQTWDQAAHMLEEKLS